MASRRGRDPVRIRAAGPRRAVSGYEAGGKTYTEKLAGAATGAQTVSSEA